MSGETRPAWQRYVPGIGVVCLLLAYVLPQPVYTDFDSAEYSHLYLTMAIVDEGSLAIEPLVRRYGATMDMAVAGGRVYTDKAPGLSFAFVPAYAAYRIFADPWPTREDALRWFRMVGVVPVAALVLVLLWRATAPLLPDAAGRMAWLLIMGLGTPLYAYGLIVFAHIYTAALLLAAYLLVRVRPGDSTISARRCAAAGACLAGAVMCDYPTALFAAFVGVAVLVRPGHTARTRCALIAGALVPAGVLALYHHVAFGSIWATGYSHKWLAQGVEIHSTGFLGIEWPTVERAWGILASPARGLFYWSPVLALAAPGWRLWWREDRREAAILGVGAIIYTGVFAGFVDWTAGWSAGARHLIPLLPFLGLALARWMRALDAGPSVARAILFITLAGVSITLWVGATLVFLFWPPPLTRPWADFIVPSLLHGQHSRMWGDGLVPHLGATLLALSALAAVVVVGRVLVRAHVRFVVSCAAVLALAWVGLAATWPTPPSMETAVTRAEIYAAMGHADAAVYWYRDALTHSPPPEVREHIVRQLQQMQMTQELK